MGFLFGEPKLDREEFNQCLKYLEEHYKLTTFQEKEADIYNEALTQYMPSLATDSHSAKEMLKVAERFKKAAHLLLTRSKQLVSVPESAGALHFAWQIVFSDYAAWVDAQYAVYVAIADRRPPFAERVQALFRQQEESHKKALQEEKKLLKRLRASGLTPSDIQRLIDKAFVAIASENWQPEEANET
jgi:replicative superfamily II helicase